MKMFVSHCAFRVPVAEVVCRVSVVGETVGDPRRIDMEWIGEKHLPVAVSPEIESELIARAPWSMIRGGKDATTGVSFWFRTDEKPLYRYWWIARFWILGAWSCLRYMAKAEGQK